jgi:hypothetical protein
MAEADAGREKVKHSRQVAAELIEAVYTLSRAIQEAVADASPPRLASAANDFSQVVGAKLVWIEDAELEKRVLDHRSFARAVGIGGTPEIARVPPKVLLDSFGRHSQVTLDSLDAHIKGQPLPAYSPPPLDSIQGLIDWTN